MASPLRQTAIERRIKPKFQSKNHEIVAGLREAAGAGAPVDTRMAIKKKAAELSSLMALEHGGDWRPVVDHEIPMVLVRPV